MWRIEHVDQTGSTNDDVAARLGAQEAGLVRVAALQTAGRGRRAGRTWLAPRGSGLTFTAALPRPLPPHALWCVTFWAALAIRAAVVRVTGAVLDLTWPNDLLLGGRKCCGILCVSRVEGERAWVGVGSGINLARPRDASLLEGIVPAPAFLSDAAEGVDPARLLDAVLDAYTAGLPELDHPDAVARRWEREAHLNGTPYELREDDGTAVHRAIARRIAADGSLIVEENGRERSIALADARVVR
ncbi:biotin--[acetyl-CoA-carboxylase] ligase [bacterium]|nr:MAG: biotin--[acetyl-CoA-carboxylase] ligase [bacterium]